MTKTLNTIIASFICITAQLTTVVPVTASTQQVALPEQVLVPGGIAIVGIPNYERGMLVKYNNERAAVLAYKDSWIALGGIPLSAKAGDENVFSIRYTNGVTLNTAIKIKAKQFPEQRLTIKNKRKVNPNAEDLKRISTERIRKRKAKSHW